MCPTEHTMCGSQRRAEERSREIHTVELIFFLKKYANDCNSVLIENVTIAQLVKKMHTICKRRCSAVFTTARHCPIINPLYTPT
jgi:hypothetical protein